MSIFLSNQYCKNPYFDEGEYVNSVAANWISFDAKYNINTFKTTITKEDVLGFSSFFLPTSHPYYGYTTSPFYLRRGQKAQVICVTSDNIATEDTSSTILAGIMQAIPLHTFISTETQNTSGYTRPMTFSLGGIVTCMTKYTNQPSMTMQVFAAIFRRYSSNYFLVDTIFVKEHIYPSNSLTYLIASFTVGTYSITNPSTEYLVFGAYIPIHDSTGPTGMKGVISNLFLVHDMKLEPEYDFSIDDRRESVIHHTEGGFLYRYDFYTRREINLKLSNINTTTFLFLNSWYNAANHLLLHPFDYTQSPHSYYDVIIAPDVKFNYPQPYFATLFNLNLKLLQRR